MPRVLNLKCDAIPEDAVYIGRGKGSIWGNKYVIGKDGSRDDVISKFTTNQLPELFPKLHLLRNKDLVCFCSPNACHGDILMTMANIPYYENIPLEFENITDWPYIYGMKVRESTSGVYKELQSSLFALKPNDDGDFVWGMITINEDRLRYTLSDIPYMGLSINKHYMAMMPDILSSSAMEFIFDDIRVLIGKNTYFTKTIIPSSIRNGSLVYTSDPDQSLNIDIEKTTFHDIFFIAEYTEGDFNKIHTMFKLLKNG